MERIVEIWHFYDSDEIFDLTFNLKTWVRWLLNVCMLIDVKLFDSISPIRRRRRGFQ